jgi:hypothetical protein
MPTPEEIRAKMLQSGASEAQINAYLSSRRDKIGDTKQPPKSVNAGLGEFKISDFYSGGKYAQGEGQATPQLTPQQQRVVDVTQKISNTSGANSLLDKTQLGDTLLGDALEGAWNVVPQTIKGIAALPAYAYQLTPTGIMSRVVRRGVELPFIGQVVEGADGKIQKVIESNKPAKDKYDRLINQKTSGQQLSANDLKFVNTYEGLKDFDLKDPLMRAYEGIDKYTDRALSYINANSVKPNETTNQWAFGIGNGLAQVTAVIATGGAAAGTNIARLAPRALSFLNTYGSVLESAKSQGIDYEDAVLISGSISAVMSAWDTSVGAEKLGLDRLLLTRSGKKAMTEIVDRTLTDAIEQGVVNTTMAASAKQQAIGKIFTQRLKEFSIKGVLPETLDEYAQGIFEQSAYMLYNAASDSDAAKYTVPNSVQAFFTQPIMEGAIGGITGGAVNIATAKMGVDQYQIAARDVLKGMVATSGAATANMDIAAPVYNLIRADVISGGRNSTAKQFREAIETAYQSGNYGEVDSPEAVSFRDKGLDMIEGMEKVANITKSHNLKPEQAFDLYQLRRMERDADATIAMFHDRMVNDAENQHDVDMLAASDDYRKALLTKEIIGGQIVNEKEKLINERNVSVSGVVNAKDGKMTTAYTNKKDAVGLLANATRKGIVVSPKAAIDMINAEYTKRYTEQQEAVTQLTEALQLGDLRNTVADPESSWAVPILEPISNTEFQVEFETLQQLGETLATMRGKEFPSASGNRDNFVDPNDFDSVAGKYEQVYNSVKQKLSDTISKLAKNKRQFALLGKKNPQLNEQLTSLQSAFNALIDPTEFASMRQEAQSFFQQEETPFVDAITPEVTPVQDVQVEQPQDIAVVEDVAQPQEEPTGEVTPEQSINKRRQAGKETWKKRLGAIKNFEPKNMFELAAYHVATGGAVRRADMERFIGKMKDELKSMNFVFSKKALPYDNVLDGYVSLFPQLFSGDRPTPQEVDNFFLALANETSGDGRNIRSRVGALSIIESTMKDAVSETEYQERNAAMNYKNENISDEQAFSNDDGETDEEALTDYQKALDEIITPDLATVLQIFEDEGWINEDGSIDFDRIDAGMVASSLWPDYSPEVIETVKQIIADGKAEQQRVSLDRANADLNAENNSGQEVNQSGSLVPNTGTGTPEIIGTSDPNVNAEINPDETPADGQDGGANITPTGNDEQQAQGGIGEAELGDLEKQLNATIAERQAEADALTKEISDYPKKRKQELAKRIKSESQGDMFNPVPSNLFGDSPDISKENLTRINNQIQDEVAQMTKRRDAILDEISKLESSRATVRANDAGQGQMQFNTPRNIGDKVNYRGAEGEIIEVYPQDEFDRKANYQLYRIRTENGERDISGDDLSKEYPAPKNIKIGTQLLNVSNTSERSYYSGVEYRNGNPVVVVDYIFNDRGKSYQDQRYVPYDDFDKLYEPLKSANEFNKVNKAIRAAEKSEPVRLGGLTEGEMSEKERIKKGLIEQAIGRKIGQSESLQTANQKVSALKQQADKIYQAAFSNASRGNAGMSFADVLDIAESELEQNQDYQSLKEQIAQAEAERQPLLVADAIQQGIESGTYTDAILNGNITAAEAVEQIEGAGLPVPIKIQELAMREENGENVRISNPNGIQFQLAQQEAQSTAAKRKEAGMKIAKRLSKVWPNIRVSFDMDEFINVLIEAGYGDILSGANPPNAFAYNGVVYMNPNAIDATTPIEEVTHVLNKIIKDQFPDLYKAGTEKVKGTAYEKDVRRVYEGVLNKMRSEGATEQEINDYVIEEALAKAVADKGARISASTLPRFTAWLNRVWAKMSAYLSGKTEGLIDIEPDQLRTMSFDSFITMYAEAVLGKTADFAGLELQGQGDANFQIAGVLGAMALDAYNEVTTRMDNLNIANQMANEGKTPAEIKIATGWEKGADRMWRYEIPDVRIKSDKKMNDWKSKANVYNAPQTAKLSDVVDAPSLFTAYPELKNMDVVFTMNMPNNVLGSLTFEDGKYVIKLDSRYPNKNSISVLAHELQHAIQLMEGFAVGGNISQFELSSENIRIETRYYEVGKELERLRVPKTEEERQSRALLLEEYKKLESELDAMPKRLYEQYRRLAGEVEARNVQTRMQYDQLQKSLTTLQGSEDIERKDQIIMFGLARASAPQFNITATYDSTLLADPDLIPTGVHTAVYRGDNIDDYMDSLIGTAGVYRTADEIKNKIQKDLAPFVHATIQNKTGAYFEGLELFSDPIVMRDLANFIFDENYESPDKEIALGGKMVKNPYRKIASALFGESQQVPQMASVENIFKAWADWRSENVIMFTDGTEYVIGGRDAKERIEKAVKLSKGSIDRFNAMRKGLTAFLHSFGFKYTANGKQRNINAANFFADVMNTHTRATAYFDKGTLGRRIFSQEVYDSLKKASPVVEQGSKDMQRLVQNKRFRRFTVHHGISTWDSVEKRSIPAFVTTPDGVMEERNVTLSVGEIVHAYLTRKTQIESYGKASMDEETKISELGGLAYDEYQRDGSTRRIYIRFNEDQRNLIDDIIDSDPDIREFTDLVEEVFNEDSRAKALGDLVRDIHGRDLKLVNSYMRVQTVTEGGTGLEKEMSGERDYDEISQIQNRVGMPNAVRLNDAVIAYDQYRRKTDDFLQYSLPIRNMQNFERIVRTNFDYAYQQAGVGNIAERFWEASTRWQNACRDYAKYVSVENPSTALKVFEAIQRNLVRSKFAFNTGIVMKQGFTFISSFGLGIVKNQYLMKELATFVAPQMFISLPASVRGKNIPQAGQTTLSNFGKSIDEIGNNPHASVIYNRIVGRYTADTEIFDTVRNLAGSKVKQAAMQTLSATRDFLDNVGMSAMIRMDRVTIVAQYRAAKAQAMAEGFTGDDLLRRTAELGEKLMYATNVMGSVGDRTQLQLSTNVFDKMLGIFTGQSQKMTNTVMQNWFEMKESGSYTGSEAIAFHKSFVNMILINAMGMALIDALRRMLNDAIYKTEEERKKQKAEYFTPQQLGTSFVNNLTGYRPSLTSQTVAMVSSSLDKDPWQEGAANFMGLEYFERIAKGLITIGVDQYEDNQRGLTAKERMKMYNTALKTSLDITESLGVLPGDVKRFIESQFKQRKPSY